MANYNLFVGRQETLAKIEELASHYGERHLVIIEGEGGIGKTFLLRHIEKLYRGREGFVVDYYDLAESPPGDWREAMHLIASLGQEHFEQFVDGFNRLIKGEYNITDPDFERRKEEIFEKGAQELSAVLEHRRLIRIVDTLDMEVPDYIWQETLLRRFLTVPNILLIIAGRRAYEFSKNLRDDFQEEQIERIKLEPFQWPETDVFFQKRAGSILPTEMRQKIHFLTNGRPVLLDLAVVWYYRNIPLPKGMEKPLQEIKALPLDELKELRQAFEFDLVDAVRSLETPLAQALLYMALVDRRNDSEIIATLMGMPVEDAKRLIKKLVELPFVKSGEPENGVDCCQLHDEVKHLINLHVWPYLDITGRAQKNVFRKIVDDYYLPRIEKMRSSLANREDKDRYLPETSEMEWQLWQLEAETLHYLMQYDEEKAFQRYETWFEDARRRNQDIRMDLLRYEVERIQDRNLKDAIELDRVDILRRRRKFDEAKAICERLLARSEDLSPGNYISAYINLGWIASYSEPLKAIEYFEKALKRAEEERDIHRAAIINNNIGQMYQRLHGSYGAGQAAIDHFVRARGQAREAKDWELWAAISNNLAYEYRLMGELDQASSLCRAALERLRKLGAQSALAYSYLTLAEIEADRNDLKASRDHVSIALHLFEPVDVKGRIDAFAVLSRIARYYGDYDAAERYLDIAIDLAEEENDERSLADLYNQYGREQRARAEELIRKREECYGIETDNPDQFFEVARDYFERSIEYAERARYNWIHARSHFELAMMHFYSEKFRDLDKAVYYLNQVRSEMPDVPVFQGHVEEMFALIEKDKGNYIAMAEHLSKAIRLLYKLKGRVTMLFAERFRKLLLNELPSKARTLVARNVLKTVESAETNQFIESIKDVCEEALELSVIEESANEFPLM